MSFIDLPPNIRWATPADEDRIRELWDICFDDPKDWTDWFFSERFSPENTLCLLRDGEIVADMQVYFYPYKIRNSVFNSACLHGVATHPNWRKKGLMGELMCVLMSQLAAAGVPIMFHTPVRAEQYYSYNHFETAKRNVFASEAHGQAANDFRLETFEFSALRHIYKSFLTSYSGMVERDERLMEMRIRDVLSDGGFIVTCRNAYALCHEFEEKLVADELCFCDSDSLSELIQTLRNRGKSIEFTLPENVKPPNDAKLAENTFNVLRILDVGAVLATLAPKFDGVIGIKDEFLAINNGNFLCDGRRTAEKADVCLGIGQFGQWISGYSEFNDENAEPSTLAQLNAALPKVPTFTIEPY